MNIIIFNWIVVSEDKVIDSVLREEKKSDLKMGLYLPYSSVDMIILPSNGRNQNTDQK